MRKRLSVGRGQMPLILTCLLVLLAGREGLGQIGVFAHVTYETQKQYGLEVMILPSGGHEGKYKVILPDIRRRVGSMAGYLIVSSDPLPPEKQNFQSYVRNENRRRDDVLLLAPLWSPSSPPTGAPHTDVILDDSLIGRSYIYIDCPWHVSDASCYCIDLSTYPLPKTRKADIRYSPAIGLGAEPSVMRRDPSDIIRTRAFAYVGDDLKTTDTYYVWYTKGNVPHRYNATIWYATSHDGHTWTEKGEALSRGPKGSWDQQSVFSPTILRTKDKYYLFYTGAPRSFQNKANEVTETAIGIAVADSPDGPWQKLTTNPILRPAKKRWFLPNSSFDSVGVDDACLLVREGKYWLYYKGSPGDGAPAHTNMEVAIAEKPEGPYVRYDGNPVIQGVHEVLVWPVGYGVVAMGGTGPEGIGKTLQYAPDGLTFSKLQDLDAVLLAPGAYRPRAFRDKRDGEMIEWGLHVGSAPGSLPFLERFDCQW